MTTTETRSVGARVRRSALATVLGVVGLLSAFGGCEDPGLTAGGEYSLDRDATRRLLQQDLDSASGTESHENEYRETLNLLIERLDEGSMELILEVDGAARLKMGPDAWQKGRWEHVSATSPPRIRIAIGAESDGAGLARYAEIDREGLLIDLGEPGSPVRYRLRKDTRSREDTR